MLVEITGARFVVSVIDASLTAGNGTKCILTNKVNHVSRVEAQRELIKRNVYDNYRRYGGKVISIIVSKLIALLI